MSQESESVIEQESVPELRAARVSQELLRRATTSQYRFESERYDFAEIVGRGGMGIVLKAHDKLLNRTVAVKFLSPELNDQQEARDVFLTEARSMAKLSHANLVPVFDVGVIEGHVMMVVEFVEGHDLLKIVDDEGGRGLDQESVLRAGIQLCRVVHYMHGQGMIHRDLKPANVIMQEDGTIKLIDFGLTRTLSGLAIRQTRVRGTPAYMSPEQAAGEPLSVTSDVYQLGVTLFELLTGRLPFEKEIIKSHQSIPAPDVREFASHIDEALAQCVDRCLCKGPDERYPSAQALMEELRTIYGTLKSVSEPSEASIAEEEDTPTPPVFVAPEEPAERGASLGAWIVAGVVIGVLGAALFWIGYRVNSSPEVGVVSEAPRDVAPATIPAFVAPSPPAAAASIAGPMPPKDEQAPAESADAQAEEVPAEKTPEVAAKRAEAPVEKKKRAPGKKRAPRKRAPARRVARATPPASAPAAAKKDTPTEEPSSQPSLFDAKEVERKKTGPSLAPSNSPSLFGN